MEIDRETMMQDLGYRNGSQSQGKIYKLTQGSQDSLTASLKGFRKARIKFIVSLPAAQIKAGEEKTMREDFAQALIDKGKARLLHYK
jgi:hypothetical protein